jgi:heme-degrading monooxygenase HmoA
MSKIIQIISFELNNQNLMEDWKKMSTGIAASLQNAPGFISRDSAVGKDKKVYCVLKWESMESQEAVKKMLESPEMEGKMKEFGRIANMKTMTEEFLEVL